MVKVMKEIKTYEEIIKKSKFIAYYYEVNSKEEVDEIYSNGLIEIKKTYDLDEKVISKKYITNENTLTNEYTSLLSYVSVW